MSPKRIHFSQIDGTSIMVWLLLCRGQKRQILGLHFTSALTSECHPPLRTRAKLTFNMEHAPIYTTRLPAVRMTLWSAGFGPQVVAVFPRPSSACCTHCQAFGKGVMNMLSLSSPNPLSTLGRNLRRFSKPGWGTLVHRSHPEPPIARHTRTAYRPA